MLKIEEIEVRGKRKAVAISTDRTEEDESDLLEIIWKALEEYEKQRNVKVTWSCSKMNSKITGIVLVYP